MSDVYHKLADHLDSLPAGYPRTESGVEIRILRHLFTEQEAVIATALSMSAEPVESIARRLEMKPEQLAPVLESMSRKGLIFRIRKKGSAPLYMAAQFVIGIWEYHVKDLTPELIRDFNQYVPHLIEYWKRQKTKQLRVIPVSKSIEARMTTMPYEEAETIIRSQSKIVVAPCICRKEHRMAGNGCDYPLEVCLTFGTGASYYEENGLGRSISRQEALEILQKGMDAGLVLQPGNSQKPLNICMCCGCCCQILKNLKKMDRPAELVCSSYHARVVPENCTACGLCAERCHMDAISVEDTAVVDLQRCIGCGVCVAGCQFDALALEAKPEQERWVPPDNVFETYLNIARERGLL